jgi:hypothetical protein
MKVMLYFIKRTQYYYEFLVVAVIIFNYHEYQKAHPHELRLAHSSQIFGRVTQISPLGAEPEPPVLVVAQVAAFSPSPCDAFCALAWPLSVTVSDILILPAIVNVLSLLDASQFYSSSASHEQHSKLQNSYEAMLGI